MPGIRPAMRFEKIRIQNFRAIDHVSIDATGGSMIVIAGPNGCGKSCIFDAIRFVKSAYGGYEDNEWDHWFNEFQLSRDPVEMKNILRNKQNESRIQVTLSLHDREKLYIHEHESELMEKIAWNQLYPGGNYQRWQQRVRIAGEQETAVQNQMIQLGELVGEFSQHLRVELKKSEISGEVKVLPNGQVLIQRNLVLESIWRVYDPQAVGLVNYHGSHRHYTREQVGGVNLNLKTQEQQERQSTLYNYANKYANIKTQMATEFVLQMMREESNSNSQIHEESLASTMKELFKRFFPGKEFQGVTANEKDELEFAVTIRDGNKHDINDLSSGEKEILFGYLRLRNSAQRQSIILLDEPELHLNPKLIQGLPQFYQKYVGEDLENQIWTVTHSDAFLREALGHVGVRVYHMRDAVSGSSDENQVREIGKGEEEEEEAIFELIGDIAAYRAGGKIVVFEGENSEFDKRVAGMLFPSYERRMNFISGGNRATVRRLHEALEQREDRGSGLVFSIVDKDGVDEGGDESKRRYTWDVYHIENYLLDSQVVLDVLRKLTLQDTGFKSAEEVEEAFRDIAEEQIEALVEHAVRARAHEAVRQAIRLRGEETSKDPAERVGKRLEESIERLTDLTKGDLSEGKLTAIAEGRREVLESAVRDEGWKREFKGRDLLRKFAGLYTGGVRYEVLRDMIVNTMAEREIRPAGMLRILEKIDKTSKKAL